MDVSNQLPEIMYSPKPLLAVLKVVWASEATFPVGSLKRNWGSSPPPVEELKTPSSREKRPLHVLPSRTTLLPWPCSQLATIDQHVPARTQKLIEFSAQQMSRAAYPR